MSEYSLIRLAACGTSPTEVSRRTQTRDHRGYCTTTRRRGFWGFDKENRRCGGDRRGDCFPGFPDQGGPHPGGHRLLHGPLRPDRPDRCRRPGAAAGPEAVRGGGDHPGVGFPGAYLHVGDAGALARPRLSTSQYDGQTSPGRCGSRTSPGRCSGSTSSCYDSSTPGSDFSEQFRGTPASRCA